MRQETRECQNCQKEFIIEPDDFDFYNKIKVLPPTWCPECRFIRRMCWRNEWKLYKRKDSLTGNLIFSAFSDLSPVKVYERDYWWSDAWNPLDYARDYDWSKPFFIQISELLKQVPLPSRTAINLVNSDYCMNAGWSKNCYLIFSADYNEDCYYCMRMTHSKDCMDCHMIQNCELCYENVNVSKCYRTMFSVNCEDCQDTLFSKDCINCSHCFGCVNLRNKSYHIFNQAYSKEKYFQKLQEFNISSFEMLQKLSSKSYSFWLQFPHKFIHGRHNTRVTGEYLHNSKNAFYCYWVRDAENVKFCQHILLGPTKDCYDYSNWGKGSELIYESQQCGNGTYDLKFCVSSHSNNKNLQYCIFCHNSSHLFGCIGLRHKQYCILNKQYTKEEYEELVPKIIQHMNDMPYIDKKGKVYKYGEFFPPELSPFAYNETIAQEYFPLTKEEALKQGYKWKDPEERNYQIEIKPEDLPDNIKDVKDDILGKVIECTHQGKCNEQCTEAFKIIPDELQFYKRMNLPLPRLCPNCRHYQRLKQRNPLKLWKRKCQCGGPTSVNGVYKNTIEHFHGKEPCPNEFETSYAPERKEIVYCEQCYLQEVV